MVIDYHDYKNKLLLKKKRYIKNKRLDFLYEKLFEWEVQEARKSSEDKIKFTFLIKSIDKY